SDVTLSNSEIDHNGYACDAIYGAGYGAYMQGARGDMINTSIHDNAGLGITYYTQIFLSDPFEATLKDATICADDFYGNSALGEGNKSTSLVIGGEGHLICNNTIHDDKTYGLAIAWAGANSIRAINNTFYNIGSWAIQILQGDNNIVENNI